MARIGQAEANARLTAAWIAALGAAEPILFAGSGPGQLLEYLPTGILQERPLHFTDINPDFLRHASGRLERLRVVGEFVVDNIEDSSLAGEHPNVVIALVLEHVAWRHALLSLLRWRARQVLIIIQENPPQIDSAVTPGREVPGTMQVFRDSARPHLIPRSELQDAMNELGFQLLQIDEAQVLDAKKMLACHFATSRTANASCK